MAMAYGCCGVTIGIRWLYDSRAMQVIVSGSRSADSPVHGQETVDI
jgi:hypothetical protein